MNESHITRQDERPKGKGRGEEAGWDLHSWQGAEGEEKFLHLGKTLTGEVISWDRTGTLGA